MRKPRSVRRPAPRLGRPVRVAGEKPTKERIFDAAVDLFSRQGYDRTSMRRIAEAVGLTESAIYRHYPSKEAILESVFDYMEKTVYSPLPPELGTVGASGVSIFRALLMALPMVSIADPYIIKIARILIGEMSHNERMRRFVQEELGQKAVEETEAILRPHVQSGALRDCDVRALARVFNSFRSMWLMDTFVWTREEPRDAAALEEDLRGPIELFERFFVSNGGKGR
jgi:AcrR family transcriptional regulator